MPFKEIYSVNFANGNRQPHVNTKGWSKIDESMRTNFDWATRYEDAHGLTLELTRCPSTPLQYQSFNSVFVQPTGGLPLASRFLMRTTFDRPWFLPVQPGTPSASPPCEITAGTPAVPPAGWAVALNVTPGPGGDLSGSRRANVTCQFLPLLGVRLNTPFGVQTDSPDLLEAGVLDQFKYTTPPEPLFTLEHLFCGMNTAGLAIDKAYTVGAGSLELKRVGVPALRDQRVYSGTSLIPQTGSVNPIGAIGVSLVTTSGAAKLSVRLRTFSIWESTVLPS